MTDTPPLPRWDMTPVFPGPASPEFASARDETIAAITSLTALFDAHGVGQREPVELDDATVRAVAEVLARYNEMSDAVRRVWSYLICLVSVDADDTQAQTAFAQMRSEEARLDQLDARLTAWVGALDVDGLIDRSPLARDHAFALRHLHWSAGHLMSPTEEHLAAELRTTGGRAWSKLRDDIEAGLKAPMEVDGEERPLGIGELQALSSNPDRDVRARAHAAETGAWESVAVPLAAALNGVKGETIALAARRGWVDPLDPMLVTNRIDRATLDALLEAVSESYPVFQRYLRAKARALGLPVLAAYDLFAPVGGAVESWPFDTATAFVTEEFSKYSRRLGALAERAVRDRWIDAEPRPGKSAGGFCCGMSDDASRILLNYAPTYEWMSALAHELGHAYHHAVQREYGRTSLQRPWPPAMTLAETASTFCEILAQRAARRAVEPAEEATILGGWLISVGLNVFTTMADVAFERRLFDARRQRELVVTELDELALTAQREVVGDAVDPETLQTSMWAAVPHYYSTELWYYNFPYAFGMLFGLGLFARYEADPESFRREFDGLLADTGMAEAADLAGRFGIDIRTPAFWRAGLNVVRADVERFDGLVG